MAQVEAGWYDDPKGSSRERYWDGEAWTTSLRHASTAKPPTFWASPSPSPDPARPSVTTPANAAPATPTANMKVNSSSSTVDSGAMRIMLFAKRLPDDATINAAGERLEELHDRGSFNNEEFRRAVVPIVAGCGFGG